MGYFQFSRDCSRPKVNPLPHAGLGLALASLRVDGNDFLAVYAATKWAAERARRGGGATVIEHFTYRKEGHSTSDDPTKYRPRTEPDVWPFGDPIIRLAQHLVKLGEWDKERHEVLEKELKSQVQKSYKESRSSWHPRLAFRDKPCQPCSSKSLKMCRTICAVNVKNWVFNMAQMNMIEAIRSALDVKMSQDPDVLVFGEDVGYFGGVFRCTAGLQEKHGLHRCFEHPYCRGRHCWRSGWHGGLWPAPRSRNTVR